MKKITASCVAYSVVYKGREVVI